MRDHGGDIDAASALFGAGDWIDLSTGINRVPYPLPPLPASAWTALPTKSAIKALCQAAANAYGTSADILPLAGAQAAIQMLPRLLPLGRAKVLAPTYNEHAAALRNAGWTVTEVASLDNLAGADLAVVVNPNNPDGRSYPPAILAALAGRVGHLVVDESFVDPCPQLSLAGHAMPQNLLVLRSFGKFYGLAGLRLGFVLGAPALIDKLRDMAGPWPVCGAALEIGRIALDDRPWAQATIARLESEQTRIDRLAIAAGWQVVGGTCLFRLYETADAAAAQHRLAQHHIWSRIFPWSPGFLRLGIPGNSHEWARLEQALGD